MMSSPAIDAVMSASALLFVKMWFSGTVTTYVRGRTMESPNHEDGWVMNFFNRVFLVPTQNLTHLPNNIENDGAVNRWSRIGNNDVANIPIGLIVLYLAAVGETLHASVLVPLIWTFVIARVAHTVFYALALQPFRTAAFSVGATAVAVTAVSLLVS